MTATLVFTQDVFSELRAISRLPVETAGVLLASIVQNDDGSVRILGRRMRWIPESSYIRRGSDHLSISSEGYVTFLAEAEQLGAVALWVHTHPGDNAIPRPSRHDEEVDRQIADLFRLRGATSYYGTLIISPSATGLTFTGYLESEDGTRIPIERLWAIGDRFELVRSFSLQPMELSAAFDRNIRAFGGAIQAALHELSVGIVGCGGTGSAVAEQLVRLGVRRVLLIDPDCMTISNITRVYGSSHRDVDRPKVEVLAEHLLRIAPDVACVSHKAMITSLGAARQLCTCDLIFGCTDDNAGRLVLSRFSTYMLTPVIDCGVLLSSDAQGRMLGIDGRVTTLAPGHACLICRGRIDLARAAAEMLTPDERARRENEGYAPALGRTEPAVVAFTTMVAATAVSELLERFIGYGPQPPPSETLLRCHDREISTNVAAPRPGHYCHPESGKIGLGRTEPFLEQTWPA